MNIMITAMYKIVITVFFLFLFNSAVHASADETILRIKVWGGYAPEEYVHMFETMVTNKYDKEIKLEVSYALGSDDFFNSVRDRKIDLITVSHQSLKDDLYGYIDKKLLIPPEIKNIPNHANIDSSLKDADFNYSEGKLFGIPLAHGPYGLIYNTAKFEQPPDSWNIFWDPAYKNKYIIGYQEYLYNINITALVMGYNRNTIHNFDALNNPEFIIKLKHLAVNSGGGWIGVDEPDDFKGMSFGISWGDSLSSLNRKEEIWKMVYPVEGTMWWIDVYALTWALSDKPFLKKIAEEWINYSLSSEFQLNHIVREVGVHPVVTNVTDMLTDEEKKQVQINTTSGSFTHQRILQHSYSQRDRNGLKLMWDKVMEGIQSNRKDQ